MSNKIYLLDKKRFGALRKFELFRNHALRYLYLFRKAQFNRSLFWRVCLGHMRHKYGLEIPWSIKAGGGLYLGHAFNITVNPKTVLGRNVNIHKGATIGQENRGKRIGAPTIGDCVWIGANATIVGSVKIGSDVLIGPGAYVNVDVPDHSIVIGNPCIIKHRDNATEGYINHTV